MRFYLHVRDGDTLIEDPDGEEFDTLDAACEEALLAARELLAKRVIDGKVLDGQKFEICNEAGELHATVPFKDAIRFT